MGETSYDEVPYSSYPYARTQPDRLCTLGRLFGLAPAEPSRCRVLELGCAGGGNLVPPIVAAARVYATEQEICDVLRECFGSHVEAAAF